MANGLSLSKDDFLKLPVKEQNGVLFDNTEKLYTQGTEIKEMIEGSKFHRKIQYSWLAVLTIVAGFGKYLNII